MLMPAAVLIVMMMLGVAVDESRVFLARRELVDLAATAANDAVTRGLDQELFRAEGTYAVSPSRAIAAVAATLAAARPSVVVTLSNVELDESGPAVTVTLTAEVRPLFRILPRPRHLEASATAEVHVR